MSPTPITEDNINLWIWFDTKSKFMFASNNLCPASNNVSPQRNKLKYVPTANKTSNTNYGGEIILFSKYHYEMLEIEK